MTALALSAAPAPRLHPLLHAVRWLAADLFSTLTFVGLFALTKSATAATLFALAGGLAQMGYQRWRRRPIDAMEVLSLGLVGVFGAAALLTHDSRFIMFKPTLIYLAVGVVMLKRGWMVRYVQADVLERAADVTNAFGYVWAAMMFATSALNAALALGGDRRGWVVFITLFPIASKVAMILVQYGVTRAVIVHRIHAARLIPA